MVNSSVRSPRCCHLPHTSDADSSKEQMGCHDARGADSQPEGTGCGCGAAAGGRRGERRAVHSPRALDFLQRHTSLGYETRLPGQPDRCTACNVCPTLPTASVESTMFVSIAYLAPRPQLATSGRKRGAHVAEIGRAHV